MMPKCSDSGNLDFYWELILRPFAMAVCLEQVAAGGTGRLLLSARDRNSLWDAASTHGARPNWLAIISTILGCTGLAR
jgi:hypothetical protein